MGSSHRRQSSKLKAFSPILCVTKTIFWMIAYYSIIRPILSDLWFTIREVCLDLLLNGLSHLMPLFYNVGKSSKTSSSHVMLVKKNWWDLYNIWISFLKCHIFLPLISHLGISFFRSFFLLLPLLLQRFRSLIGALWHIFFLWCFLTYII